MKYSYMISKLTCSLFPHQKCNHIFTRFSHSSGQQWFKTTLQMHIPRNECMGIHPEQHPHICAQTCPAFYRSAGIALFPSKDSSQKQACKSRKLNMLKLKTHILKKVYRVIADILTQLVMQGKERWGMERVRMCACTHTQSTFMHFANIFRMEK